MFVKTMLKLFLDFTVSGRQPRSSHTTCSKNVLNRTTCSKMLKDVQISGKFCFSVIYLSLSKTIIKIKHSCEKNIEN